MPAQDECMGQRSTINHNVQLFITLNNQYAIIMIIQWPPVEIIYVQTLSQSNFHHNMEIHYLSVH